MNGAVIIRGEDVEQHDVQRVEWTVPALPIGATAQLLMELMAAGTVRRWELLDGALELARRQGVAQALQDAADLLDGALELARREGAGQALQDAADDVDSREGTDGAGIVRWLELRAERARAGQL